MEQEILDRRDQIRAYLAHAHRASNLEHGFYSDVDVLVSLTDDDPDLRWEVQRLAARVSLEYDLLLSVRAVGRSQWDRLVHFRSPLYQALEADGITLTRPSQP